MFNYTFTTASLSSLKKYQEGIDNRVAPRDIVSGSDFIFNATLGPQTGCEAFTVPLRTTDVPEMVHRASIWIVRYTLLDPDMRPKPVTSAISTLGAFHLNGGGMLALTDELYKSAPGITAGYLTNYA